jgi:spoIIIJ-associated protein
MENTTVEKIVHEFLTSTGFVPEEELSIKQDTTNPLWFSLHVKNGHMLIGHDGETLHALTYLLKRIIDNKFNEETAKAVTLDINDFYKKRVEQLKTTAHMLAERARFFKSSIDLDPMNPFERRIVHEYLQSYTDISTDSVGEGRNRHIVIKFVPKESI